MTVDEIGDRLHFRVLRFDHTSFPSGAEQLAGIALGMSIRREFGGSSTSPGNAICRAARETS
jgi:hypothetical protein